MELNESDAVKTKVTAGLVKSEVMTKSEAAKYCRLSTESLDRYRKSGDLGYVQFSRRLVFTKQQLDEFLARFTVKAKAENSEGA